MAALLAELLPETRLHSLPLSGHLSNRIFVKRDDEAAFALAAGKMRKYASLIPWLQQAAYNGVIVIGGSHSNNVLAAAQLLPQYGLEVALLVKASHTSIDKGNALLTHLLQPQTTWHQVEPGGWHDVMQKALQLQEKLQSDGKKYFILPEGAFVPEALPGALHLASDLLRNAQTQGLDLAHVFVDAGTGLSAAGLVLGLAAAGHSALVHIISMAEKPAGLEARIATCQGWYTSLFPERKELPPLRYRISQPRNARAFGSVNRTVIQHIQRMARTFGLLTEPIYSAKLFAEAEIQIEELELKGDIVLVHSGGLQTISGFAHLLK